MLTATRTASDGNKWLEHPPRGFLAHEERDNFSAVVDKRYDFWSEDALPAAVPSPSSSSSSTRSSSGTTGTKEQSFASLMKHKNELNDLSDIADDFVLPAGSIARGQKYFKKYCRQCHSIYSDNRAAHGMALLGPTMFEVCGRASGMEEGGGKKLGENMRTKDILWTDSALMNYMKNPRLTGGGPTQMNFPGIRSFDVRVDVVHYLHTLNAEQSPHLVASIATPAQHLQ
ncbi:unnamed protein product [Amoebophrya sp. A25]|nr:unnamed protein product [Amoebophrya sp. A25]|eukprot:GSA25T00020268001.1